MVIIIVLKPDFGVYPGPDLGHVPGWPLIGVNIMIKIIIIIILKPYLGVDLGQNSGWPLNRFNIRIKMIIIIILKLS